MAPSHSHPNHQRRNNDAGAGIQSGVHLCQSAYFIAHPWCLLHVPATHAGLAATPIPWQFQTGRRYNGCVFMGTVRHRIRTPQLGQGQKIFAYHWCQYKRWAAKEEGLKVKGPGWQEIFGNNVNNNDEFKMGIFVTPNVDIEGGIKRWRGCQTLLRI